MLQLGPFWHHFLDECWINTALKPILFGLSLATIGWLALTILLEMPVLLGFVAGHVTYMIGLGFAYSNMMTTGMSLLEEKRFGDGNTLFNTLQQFSGAIATAIVATITISLKTTQIILLRGQRWATISLIFLLTLLVIVLIACWNYFRKQKQLVSSIVTSRFFSFLKIVVFMLLASEYKVRTRQQLAR